MSKTTWDRIVTEDELKQAKKARNTPFYTKTIFRSSLADEAEEGWEFLSEFKNPKKIKVKKDKPQDEIFEDTVWTLFANLGFSTMNKDKYFVMSYGSADAQTQQIDVFAVDEETIIFVECKSAQKMKDGVFKKEIEALGAKMNGLRIEALSKYPDRKCKFIFATRNYRISHEDQERMLHLGIAHFNENIIAYYQELTRHLGSCARYQLLGNIFAKQQIKGMENRIPAIKGKMGGHTYYSFSIEPEKLLKIGYILHRSEANSSMMPTYQRLIKKSRLAAVRKFINDDHGYFPNSIIISIDTPKEKPLRFDRSEKQVSNAVSDLGILHLPQQYRSAFIIDGQHRLYGYSDSPYAMTNSIPVVAFENMKQTEQVRLFMDINENQKAVSKKLRNILNADMLWDSPKESDRRDALRLKIAQDLGEKNTSPLYGCIDIGEEQSTSTRCVTIECIRIAINVGNFLSKYDRKNVLIQNGIFDTNHNETTLKILYGFIDRCLTYVKNSVPDEWNKGSANNGILTINNGIGGLIRILNDIANLLMDQGDITPLKDTPEYMAKVAEYYLDPVCRFIKNISDDTRSDIRKTYGGNGPMHCWRHFQRAIARERSEFNPDGLTKYWEDHGKEFNNESIEIMRKIESSVKKYIRENLEDRYGEKWINEIPQAVFTTANKEASKYRYETGEDKDFWDFISIIGCKEIVVFGKNWSEIFEKKFTLPSESKKSGGKQAKVEWMVLIDKLQRRAIKSNFTVAKTEYQTLGEALQQFTE